MDIQPTDSPYVASKIGEPIDIDGWTCNSRDRKAKQFPGWELKVEPRSRTTNWIAHINEARAFSHYTTRDLM